MTERALPLEAPALLCDRDRVFRKLPTGRTLEVGQTGSLYPNARRAAAEDPMSRRTITRLKPLLMPGISAILALLSLTTAPQNARAMVHTLARWSAELAPPHGSIGPHGSVLLERGKGPNHTRVLVVISGDTPGALRPWHLHAGICGEGGPIMGPEQAYATIRINARGNGVAVIDLPIPFPEAGALFVNVHESLKRMDTIVTCGQLAH